LSLKPPFLGLDVHKNEYWDFCNEMYVKYRDNGKWGKFITEDEVAQLDDSLCVKGIRERKLKENLKKVKGKLRLK